MDRKSDSRGCAEMHECVRTSRRSFVKAGMTRHLKTCGEPSPSAKPGLHLLVEGRYAKEYWMHLAVPAASPLERVDAFLRKIWLECCGHLSAFTIAGEKIALVRDGGKTYALYDRCPHRDHADQRVAEP